MNKERGEVYIKIQGQDYLARPSHEAIANVEGYTEKGIIEVVYNFHKSRQSLKEVVAVLYFSMKAVKPKLPWKIDEFSEIVVKQGLLQLSAPATGLVSMMVTGETEAELEEKNDAPTGS